MAELVLASASPRRLELLRLAGLEPVVRPTDVDEALRPGERPDDYVARLARDKASTEARAGGVTVGADTAVVVDGEVLGKPVDEAHARAMLRRLSGRAHLVSTGVAVAGPDGALAHDVVTTTVVMTALSDDRIDAYVATREPLDKAGGYAVQGRAAAFVERIEGSWTNIVGLPLVETLAMLREAGVPPP